MSRALTRRSADHRQRKPMTGSPSVIGTMYAGLAMTVIAMIVPYIDHARSNTLAHHIGAGYPTYTDARIDTAATTYLVYLSIIGVLGVVGWLWTVRAIKAGKRWARVPRPHCSRSARPSPSPIC